MLRAAPQSRRLRGITCLEAALVSFLLLVLLCLFLPALGHHHHHRANRTKCSNNLRQLAMASIQYADDKRFFPHVTGPKQLDGGFTSNHTPRKVRTLLWYGYHDNPEGFICPSSYDVFIPVSDRRTWEDMKRWSWDGKALAEPSSATPLVDGETDPTLEETMELSYGLTRRFLNTNVRSTTKLGADRSARPLDEADELQDDVPAGHWGNHRGALNVAFVDGSVTAHGVHPEAGEVPAEEELSELAVLVPPGATFGSGVPPGRTRNAQLVRVFFRGPLPWMLGWIVVSGVLFWRARGWWRRTQDEDLPPRLRRARERAEGRVAVRKRWFTALVQGIGLTPLGSEPERGPGGRPKVLLSPGQRCPFCHEGLVEGDDLVACAKCQTLLHRECVQEGGVCSTLGCRNARPRAGG